MRFKCWFPLICTFLSIFVEVSLSRSSKDKLGYHDYSDIVRDLIKNWESPIVYLRQLGYLPKDYEDTSKIKPNLDALMSRIEQNDQPTAQSEDTKLEKPVLKKKRASVSKLKKCRQHREANGNQNINYPNVDQLMNMAQQFKKLMPQQQQPAEEQSNAKQDANIEVLQRMVERTSQNVQPTQNRVAAKPVGCASYAMPQVAMEPTAMLQLLGSNAIKKPTSSEVSGIGDNSAMSMYGKLSKSYVNNGNHSPQFSRQNEAQSTSNVQPEIEAPQYLNWDITNKRLKQISPYAKDAYVDKLVQIFVKKQKTFDILQHNPMNR